MGRVAAAVVLVAILVVALWPRDDDRPVDRAAPESRRAVALAQEVVPGRLVDLRRDEDNGKWEVTLRRDGRDYEVELDRRDLSLLRVDYD